MDFFNSIRDFFRNNPRMWIVLVIAVILAGGVVFIVYSGASVQVGQFFAAEPSAFPNVCGYNEYKGNALCACGATYPGQSQPNYKLLPHVCTRAFQEGDTDYSDGQWWVWDQQYDHPYPACQGGHPYLAQRLKPDGTTFSTPQGCVEKPPDCPDGFYAFDKGGVRYCYEGNPNGGGGGGGGGVVSPTPTPAPTATPTPTPSTPPVVCTPQNQTIASGATASLTATGGNGTFQWNVTGGGVIESGGNQNISISYQTAGNKTVRVNSGTSSAFCTVVVQGATPTPTPASNGTNMTVAKTARDLSTGSVDTTEMLTVTENATIQFDIRVVSVATQPLQNIMVKDVVPPGMSYQVGSTLVNGQAVSVDTITTSGLQLGTLEAGEEFTVRWSAIADRVGLLVTGIQESRPPATITANGIPPVTDDVTLQILGTGTGTGPTNPTGTPVPGAGGVNTGPDDAVMIALLTAAALTLLYTAYTRSPGFLEKEIKKISGDQGPLDFRS